MNTPNGLSVRSILMQSEFTLNATNDKTNDVIFKRNISISNLDFH